MQTPKELIEHLAKITSKFQFDPNIIAQQAFEDGFSFENTQTAWGKGFFVGIQNETLNYPIA